MKPASLWRFCAAVLALALAAGGAARAATIVIVNQNAPGVGFNDPTPAPPVGGNTGTTLGQQRLSAFARAATIWGAALTSAAPIRIGAAFVPLACNTTGAVLGAAGASEVWSDFPNAPRPGTWYPAALASKLAGTDLTDPANPHILARFNSRLGLFADCVPGLTFYLGLDNRAPASQIDLVTTLLHEMAHGLGFQTFTDDETGQPFFGIPSVWDYHLVDNRSNTPWVAMTNAQRAASAITWRGLSWDGPNVTAATRRALAARSNLHVGGANAGQAGGNYYVGDASFGPPLETTPVSGQLMPVLDQANGTGLACTPLNATNALAVRNNIAMVDRGACEFTVKARNVQNAGALAMVVVDNTAGEVSGLPGADPAIRIPAVRITLADGDAIKAVLAQRSRTRSGVIATLAVNDALRAGTDDRRRMLMYTPNPVVPGSSVSHYTTEARPNQLMEPSINRDLTHSVQSNRELTLPLLRDIGW
jgi:hypothetical protein